MIGASSAVFFVFLQYFWIPHLWFSNTVSNPIEPRPVMFLSTTSVSPSFVCMSLCIEYIYQKISQPNCSFGLLV